MALTTYLYKERSSHTAVRWKRDLDCVVDASTYVDHRKLKGIGNCHSCIARKVKKLGDDHQRQSGTLLVRQVSTLGVADQLVPGEYISGF